MKCKYTIYMLRRCIFDFKGNY